MIRLVCCLFACYPVEWRIWEEREERARAVEATSLSPPSTEVSVDFTVMSYNILADDLLKANLELYTHCPLEVLDWSYRCTLLLEEILKWAPDVRKAVFISLRIAVSFRPTSNTFTPFVQILCLQEVQESHYHSHLYPSLSQRGGPSESPP